MDLATHVLAGDPEACVGIERSLRVRSERAIAHPTIDTLFEPRPDIGAYRQLDGSVRCDHEPVFVQLRQRIHVRLYRSAAAEDESGLVEPHPIS